MDDIVYSYRRKDKKEWFNKRKKERKKENTESVCMKESNDVNGSKNENPGK